MTLSRQEIFNEVKAHLLTQMQQSTDEKGFCLYQSPTGLKCAAGIFIPDELYSPDFEGITVRSIMRALPTIAPEDIFFLRSLQTIHDINPPEHWEEKLEQFRKQYDLK